MPSCYPDLMKLAQGVWVGFVAWVCMGAAAAQAAPPVRVGIAGLVHGHVEGLLYEVTHRPGFELVGISETHGGAVDRYFGKFGLSRDLLSRDVGALIARTRPEVIAAFGTTRDQLAVVRAAVAARIPVMLEKPMGADVGEAAEIERLSRESGVPVMINYETTWYPNTQFLFSPSGKGFVGNIRKVVVRSGHRGPLEIGVHPEFFEWLSDPSKGGGALLDFGCYGVQFLTELFRGVKAVAVTAVVQTLKGHPAYSRVEDEATIVVEYPGAQGIVQASWNWPVDRKDWEIYGDQRSLTSQGRNEYTFKEPSGNQWSGSVAPPGGADGDPLNYLAHLAGKGPAPSKVTFELGSPALNLEVSRILSAAARSAREGRRIPL